MVIHASFIFVGVFVDEENLQKFSDLTDSFFNQTDPSSQVSITLNFYNETPTLVLDDTYLTDGMFKYRPSCAKSHVYEFLEVH